MFTECPVNNVGLIKDTPDSFCKLARDYVNCIQQKNAWPETIKNKLAVEITNITT